MRLTEVTAYLDRLLELDKFRADKSNNGLQLEAGSEVTKVVAGVDCCQELFAAAAKAGADLVLVHHGMSWGGEPRYFTGITARRMATLFCHGISLYAAHLPLDAHPELGNNAQLAQLAELGDLHPSCIYDGLPIGFTGMLPTAMTTADLAAVYEKKLNCRAKIFDLQARQVSKVAVVSGGGGMEALQDAISGGADVLLTGEFDQLMYHVAYENRMPVIALGHYASETVGVKALLQRLCSDLGLPGQFIDLPTGV